VFSFVESLASQSQTQEAQQILAKLNQVAPMPNHSPIRETQAKAFF